MYAVWIYKQKVKLYEEVESDNRGRRSGDLNIWLQVGLTHTMSLNTAFQRIITTANIQPHSRSAMQKQANKVGESIVDLNKLDLKRQRHRLKRQQNLKNLPSCAGIRVESDARYNNKLGSGGGRTPFQPATQVTYTVTENMTPRKKIIGLFTGNKLCQSKRHKQGLPHPNCTANVEEDHTIGDEGRWAEQVVAEMREDDDNPLNIEYATTDGDSNAARGLSAGQKKAVVNLSCSIHLAESQRRALDRATFSKDMLSPSTKKDKQHMQSLLARNLKRRCTAEFKGAHARATSIDDLIHKLSYATDSVVKCYKGECGQLCSQRSFAC